MTSLGSEHTEAENAAREQARQARDAALRVLVYVVMDDAQPDSVANKTMGFIQAIESFGWRLEQMTTTRSQDFAPAIHTLMFRSTSAPLADSDHDGFSDTFSG
jgi:hypothetical protein